MWLVCTRLDSAFCCCISDGLGHVAGLYHLGHCTMLMFSMCNLVCSWRVLSGTFHVAGVYQGGTGRVAEYTK